MTLESIPERNLIIAALRGAVWVSPNSSDLRHHFAKMLFGYGKAEDAEQECREILSLFPQDPKLMVGLARAFFQQGKYTSVLVMVEAPMKRSYPQWSFYKNFLSEFFNNRFNP